jgi:LAO/AO transport system kinase
VIKSVATSHEGIDELIDAINKHHTTGVNSKRPYLLVEKAYRLIQNHRMKSISKQILQKQIETEFKKPDFNLYRFVKENAFY